MGLPWFFRCWIGSILFFHSDFFVESPFLVLVTAWMGWWFCVACPKPWAIPHLPMTYHYHPVGSIRGILRSCTKMEAYGLGWLEACATSIPEIWTVNDVLVPPVTLTPFKPQMRSKALHTLPAQPRNLSLSNGLYICVCVYTISSHQDHLRAGCNPSPSWAFNQPRKSCLC